MAKLDSLNPHDNSVLGSVKIASKEDILQSVKKAKVGFAKWREVPLKKRAQIVAKVSLLLKKDSKKLAELISKEMGKPIDQATSEVVGSANDCAYVVKEALKCLNDETLHSQGKIHSVLRYDPVGVVVAIKPWNYPINTAILTVVPALMAGNSVIFKPAEETSLVGEALSKIFWAAGVPKDVFQVIFGRGQTGAALVDSDINMVTFTGSTAVGKEIIAKCVDRNVKVQAEMGGSTPAIVLNDADVDRAVNAIIFGRFLNAGQVCNAIKRVYVEKRIAAKFTKLLVAKVAKLKVGNPLDKNTQMGPMVSADQLKLLQSQVTRAVVQSGRILTGGRRIREGDFMKGNYHEPTVMVFVHQKMDIMNQEVFGPVLPVCTVENLDQAIEFANQTNYGLTATVFTSSKEKARRVENEVLAGGVYVNDEVAFYDGSPWLGIKDSGFGVSGGRHGIWQFTHIRHVHEDFSAGKMKDYWFQLDK